MTKKRALLLFLFFFLTLLGFVFYRELNPQVKIAEEDSDKGQSSPTSNSAVPRSLKIEKKNADNQQDLKKKTKTSDDDNFAAFDQMEKDWLKEAREILGEEFYSSYLSLREANDKEKLRAYKEYHEYLRQKYGDNFSYNISEDQSIREKKINEKYLNDLLKLIGQEKFKSYLKTKDHFNEELLRKNAQAIQIEF